MERSKIKILDKTEVIIIWGTVDCPKCGAMEHIDSNEIDIDVEGTVKCRKCKTEYIVTWE